MKTAISLLLCICMCLTLIACSNQTELPSDNTMQQATTSHLWQYISENLAQSNLKLDAMSDLKDAAIENGIIINQQGKYAILANNAKYVEITPSLPVAKIEDNHPWEQLYGGYYYYHTDKAWYIRAGQNTYSTYPIDGEVVWMQNEGNYLQFITFNQNQYAWQVIDETGAIINSQPLDIIKVQSSCGYTYLYTHDQVLKKSGSTCVETSATTIPADCQLLDEFQYYIANRQVKAVYYFNKNDTLLHYQYESKEPVYDIYLPTGYTVDQLLWFEWCNDTINMLMQDRTWWSCPATNASVVGFELVKDSTASQFLQQNITQINIVNGELLLTANDGYLYHHSAYNDELAVWVGGVRW